MQGISKKTWILTAVVAVVVLLAGSVIGYGAYYADRALPNVSVAGESVSGMTEAEVASFLQTRVEETKVSITIDGKKTDASLRDLGYNISVPETVEAVFAGNESFGGRIEALFNSTDVMPVTSVNVAAQDAYVDKLTEGVESPVVNAAVVLNEEGTAYTFTPGQEGTEIDSTKLKAIAQEAAGTLTSAGVDFSSNIVAPLVTTEAAEAAALRANELISVPVSLTTTLNVYEPSAAEKAGWVVLPAAFTGEAAVVDRVTDTDVTIDAEKIGTWVVETTTASNDEPQPGLRNVNSRGDVVKVVSEGVSGWIANNAANLTEGLVAAFETAEPYSAQITYDEVPNTEWEDRLIADGAENLAYPAVPGERWIDINLSNFTTTAYEGSTIVRGPVSIVPGAPGTPTVTGQYAVWAKVASQTMSGNNLDGSRYETPNVPWILYFYSGYALHGAYWRSSFGYGGPGGSHGCVNMPVGEAKWFYDWASVGTPVVSHY